MIPMNPPAPAGGIFAVSRGILANFFVIFTKYIAIYLVMCYISKLRDYEFNFTKGD